MYPDDGAVDAEQVEETMTVELGGLHAVDHQHAVGVRTGRVRNGLRLVGIQQSRLQCTPTHVDCP